MPSDRSLYVEATDADLVLAIARGQLEGLAEAYERHGGSVLSMTLQRCGTEDMAQDATRAAFMTARRAVAAREPFVVHGAAHPAMRARRAQMSSGATRVANSSTRLLPSAGHPQTR